MKPSYSGIKFEDSPKLKGQRRIGEKEKQRIYHRAKVEIGLASDPDELVNGLSDFLMEVGFSSSFLDRNEIKMRGQ